MKYKLLGHSGLRVSEICLGTMTFGTEWTIGGDRKDSQEVFDVYASSGGNFLDTANRYTEGTSEKWLADFVEADRDHFVLATKYTLQDRKGDPNFSGNHRKNLFRSVEASMKRLKTDYIDLLWLHMWDFTTSPQEVMRALDDLIRMGKVHYIGISDTPAWIVAQANTLAELKNWNRFCALQVEYSLIQRTPERDLIPMARSFDLALTPWAPLAGGALTGKYLKDGTGKVPEHSLRRNERSTKITLEVVAVAEELGILPAQVALAWMMNKHIQNIPIVGARRADQLIESLKAIDIQLPQECMNRLDAVSAIEPGFPHDFLVSDAVKDALGGYHDRLLKHR